MDQLKIGKFIAESRKKNNLTQMHLAEMLGITDRAVSKWETGKAMPDSAIMLELCDVLHITVNDLLNGEVVSSQEYREKLETKLLETLTQKEQAEKRLLNLSVLSAIFMVVLYFFVLVLAWFVTYVWVSAIIFLSMGIAIFSTYLWSRADQKVGYYKCSKCGNTYQPAYGRLSIAFGGIKTKFFRCSGCKQRSWHHKVYHKD